MENVRQIHRTISSFSAGFSVYAWMHEKLAEGYEEMTNIPRGLAQKCITTTLLTRSPVCRVMA